MFILFNICDQSGVVRAFHLIKELLNIARIVVPIGLIVMTGVDIFKKVIKPDDKDGQRKILIRVIASVLVFFVPFMVDFIVNLATIGGGDTQSGSSCRNAWRNA